MRALTLAEATHLKRISGSALTIAEINITSGSGNIRCTYSGTSTLPASGTLTISSGSGDSTITYTSYESESYNPFLYFRF